MTRLRVLHLIDDTTAGGVTRVVDHILHSPALSASADHQMKVVSRERATWGRFDADVIVSHLSINWRNLPRFLALRRQNRSARLIHVEHSYTENFVRHCVRSKRRFSALLHLSYGLFERVVAVSNGQADWLVSAGLVPRDRIAIIRSCVDLAPFRALPAPSGRKKVIGAIGRLERQKGFDILIMAVRLSMCADIDLHIYGTGAEDAALRKLSGGDPRITFKGFVADPVQAMAAVDVVAMSSRWEAYGLVAIEALAAGRTLMVNEVDGLRDHLALGAIGTPDTRPEIWRDCIEGVYTNSKNLDVSRPTDQLEADFVAGWHALLFADDREGR